MKIEKYKIISALLGFGVLGLVLLLVRESEGRVSAETRLNDLKYKMETVNNDSQSLALELRGTIHDLEAKIADMTEKHEAEMAEKAEQIRELNTQLEDAAKKYDDEVARGQAERQDIESRAKTDSGKLNQVIKEKSEKLSELSGELEKASARYSKLLREKEEIEAKVISTEADISALKTELKKAQGENARLTEAIAALTKKPETIHD